MGGKKQKRGKFLKETPTETKARQFTEDLSRKIENVYDPATREFRLEVQRDMTPEMTGVAAADREIQTGVSNMASVGNVANAAVNATNAVRSVTDAMIRSEGQEAQRKGSVLADIAADQQQLITATAKGAGQAAAAETTAESYKAARDLSKTEATRGVIGSAVNQMAQNYGATNNPFTKIDTRINPDTGAAEVRNKGIFGLGTTDFVPVQYNPGFPGSGGVQVAGNTNKKARGLTTLV